MAINRTRGSKAKRAAATGATHDETPPDGDENHSDDDADDDNTVDHDDGDTDAEKNDDAAKDDEILESQKELDAAEQLALEEHKAASAVREREITRQQTTGAGFVNYDDVRAKEDKARMGVRQKSVLKRGPGVYVTSPVTTSDENGQRIEFPVGVRLPDAIVSRMENQRVKGGNELLKLVNEEVLEDLRV